MRKSKKKGLIGWKSIDKEFNGRTDFTSEKLTSGTNSINMESTGKKLTTKKLTNRRFIAKWLFNKELINE